MTEKICRICGNNFKSIKIGIHICVECMNTLKEKKHDNV